MSSKTKQGMFFFYHCISSCRDQVQTFSLLPWTLNYNIAAYLICWCGVSGYLAMHLWGQNAFSFIPPIYPILPGDQEERERGGADHNVSFHQGSFGNFQDITFRAGAPCSMKHKVNLFQYSWLTFDSQNVKISECHAKKQKPSLNVQSLFV
jgi:hypothetical protein